MFDLRAPARVALAGLVSLGLASGLPSAAIGFAETGAKGTLDVRSEPAGATVYVDGTFSGHTPLTLELAAGEHRVKLVKIGYLEKARLVRLQPGETTTVNLPLTTTSLTAAEAAKGGGKRKLALIGLGALAAGTTTYLVANRNHPPVAGIIIANPYTALMAVMNVTFRADDARDEDNDPLSYEWHFGDGSQAQGRAANHIYSDAGSYSVTLTVSDGKDSSSAPPVTVVVRDLNGTWVSSSEGTVRSWTIQQAGTTVSGSYHNSTLSQAQGVGVVSGSVLPPNAVRVTAAIPGITPFTYEGFLDERLDRLEGRANGSGFNNTPLTFLRQ